MSCEGWKEVKLGDVIQFNPKLSLKKGTLYKKVTMQDLIPFERKISGWSKEKFTGGARFENGDTLLARITPCLENGKTAFVDILEQGEIGFGSTEFIVMRPKENITNEKFVYYLAISPNFRSVAIQSMTGSSGRQRVQLDLLKDTLFPIPPLEEQKEIVRILSSIDDKIELNHQINQDLEEMAQAIFKSWFIDFEPFRDGEFVDSELGPIPKGWEVKELKKLVKISTESVRPNNNPEVKYEHYSIPAFDSNKFPAFDLGAEIKSNKYVVKNNSILVSKLNPTTKRIWIPLNVTSNAICSTEFINYQPIIDDNYYFVYGILNSKKFSEFLQSNVTGSTNSRQRVSPKKTLNYKIVVPNNEKIIWDYCNLVKEIFEKIHLNLLEIEDLRSVRDTLLPKLMSGEIRV